MNAQRRNLIAEAVARRNEQRLEQESARYDRWTLRESARLHRSEQTSIQQELGEGDE